MIIILLYILLFGILNILIYLRLNKKVDIHPQLLRRIIYFLLVVTLIHFFNFSYLLRIEYWLTLLFFSLVQIGIHYLVYKKIFIQVKDLDSPEWFKAFGYKFFGIFFLNLFPLMIYLTQSSFIIAVINHRL
jgi:hypothetical protein